MFNGSIDGWISTKIFIQNAALLLSNTTQATAMNFLALSSCENVTQFINASMFGTYKLSFDWFDFRKEGLQNTLLIFWNQILVKPISSNDSLQIHST